MKMAKPGGCMFWTDYFKLNEWGNATFDWMAKVVI
jgi:hypothetical protein